MSTDRVRVPGGELAVESTAGDTAPILAIHGVSSNTRLWNWLHAEAPELTLVAPDLRGRAGSFDVEGSSSVAQHAEDMVAVLDALGLDRVTVCGMSMGGFVAVALAVTHPERVQDLVLVDGGFPMANEGLTPDTVRAAFTPQASRREQRFADLAAYRDAFVAGLPLLDVADPLLADYLAHDLGDDGRVRLSRDAVLADAVDTLLTPPAWQQIGVPTRFLAAEWSVGTDSAPAYPDAAVERFRGGLTSFVHAERIPGVDHAASIMTRRGAAAVAEQVRATVVGGRG